jgi:manganese transport protein
MQHTIIHPQNLYLHSSIVQTRRYPRTPEGRRFAVRYATLDSSVSLLFAFAVNAAILILAGASFYYG